MENRIKQIRKSRKITQAQMAADLGVAESTVQNWEGEKTDMTGYSLYMLCQYFGVSPDEIYGSGKPSKEWAEQQELAQIYKKMNDDGRIALMATARALSSQFDSKNNQVREDTGARSA